MKRSQKTIQIAIAIILALSLLAPAVLIVGSPDHTTHAQPALAQLAADAPDQLVRVIIQKADSTDQAERLAERLGGTVLKDLQIINAFVARMSAAAAIRLGSMASVNWVSLDAPVESAGKPSNDPCANNTCPPNYYLDTLGVPEAWALGYQGQGVTVAVVDSGIATDRDFTTLPGKPFTRILKQISFNPNSFATSDEYGHGTHVAGIIAGHGGASAGFYAGIAPQVNLINLKISDDTGMAYESDTVDALQWVMENKATYNIRVVNMSINSTVEQSYHTSPIDAAAEILWFNGIVIVASAGNKGPGGGFNTANAAPANDPFIITVGASNEHATGDPADDTVAAFSAYGTTQDGFRKPDIIAPGKDIISVLASSSDWYNDFPERAELGKEYFRISGTSMAAPMVSGAAALLLQAEPNLTPDQVKYRLMNAGGTITNDQRTTYPYLDVYAALTTPTTASANAGIVPHQLLAKMALMAYWSSQNGEENIDWANVNWDAVNWNAVNWNAVNWNAVNWNAVNWNAVNWNAVNWNAVNWNAVNWNAVNWNAVNWNSVNWNSVNWNSVNWNAVNWNSVNFSQ